ncbi:hypothetical protein [Streptacidiphilus rugosus]|uniref:hypothetical protein n=1 Tax=Streptacidiphilus rugosus TaxID=405783 RepID=UPI00056742C2|nr:hypothetical protein [Streptacidiphilus rugosus]
MTVELIAFSIVGLAIGLGAAVLLSDLFPAPRVVTALTGLCSALLLGGVAHAAFGDGHPVEAIVCAALGSAAMVSLLARPDQRSARHRPKHA